MRVEEGHFQLGEINRKIGVKTINPILDITDVAFSSDFQLVRIQQQRQDSKLVFQEFEVQGQG